jgi:glycerate kinase
MRVLAAPDSFKGTFTAAEVAAAMAAGVEAAGHEGDVCPLADGGEGTAEALRIALGGERRSMAATGPLGEPVDGSFVLLGDGRAAVDAAAASGLALVPERERDAEAADTRGTGELIAAAVEAGATEVLVGVGGTASTDGGRAAVEAITEAGVEARIACLCDVTTPWERAAAVFAPQKGAGSDAVVRLSERLDRLAAGLPRDPRALAMTGAGGGLAGGLWAAFDARLWPGATFVGDAARFDDRLRDADLVITGEGRLDETSLEGKLVAEVAARARRAGVPVHAIVGRLAEGFDPSPLGLASVSEATTLAEITSAAAGLLGELGA